MSDYGHGFEPRFKLEEAKFFFNQMELSLQNPKDRSSITRFLYYLDAFLCAIRNVTWVFQKEFKDDRRLMEWYNRKAQRWKKDKVMRLFVEMRNISLKEHTPETLTLSASKGGFDTASAVIEDTPNGNIQIKIPIHSSNEKALKNQNQLRSSAVYFYKVPHWFDENPDVILLCKRYVKTLEEFVAEAERKVLEKRE